MFRLVMDKIWKLIRMKLAISRNFSMIRYRWRKMWPMWSWLRTTTWNQWRSSSIDQKHSTWWKSHVRCLWRMFFELGQNLERAENQNRGGGSEGQSSQGYWSHWSLFCIFPRNGERNWRNQNHLKGSFDFQWRIGGCSKQHQRHLGSIEIYYHWVGWFGFQFSFYKKSHWSGTSYTFQNFYSALLLITFFFNLGKI